MVNIFFRNEYKKKIKIEPIMRIRRFGIIANGTFFSVVTIKRRQFTELNVTFTQQADGIRNARFQEKCIYVLVVIAFVEA